jgi:hypothetical protein
MPLINLKTDLTSLKYGKDTLGGGYSGQPYIQTPIPSTFNDLGPRQDFVLRGGVNAITDSLTDVKRLSKMFIDTKSPNGLLFIAKQQLLSRTAVRTQTSGILNEGIYSPLNTLAEAGVVALGTHLNKQGINPFAQTGAYAYDNQSLYFNKVKPNPNTPTLSTNTNRLVKIYNEKQAVENIDPNVRIYTGGPGSILGVGKTAIRFADQRTGDNNAQKIANPDYFYGKNQQRSVDISNNLVGGLQIEPLKPWTWSGPKIITPNTTYDLGNFLPSFDVNKPQSGSLSQVPNNAETWTPKSNKDDSSKYLKTFAFSSGNTGPTNNGVSGKYFRLTGVSFTELYNDQGKLGGFYNFSVYDSATIEGNTWPKTTPLASGSNTVTYTQQDIIDTNINPLSGNPSSPVIQDFRKILRDKIGTNGNANGLATGTTSKSLPYNGPEAGNIENRVNIGDPGQRKNKYYGDYQTGVQGLNPSDGTPNGKSIYGSINIPNIGSFNPGLDVITSIPVYRSETVIREDNTKDNPVNDLVKFRIAVIDNDAPSYKTYMHFRAFLGGMSDSYSANWNGFNYLGRGEQFYTYGGFTRSISLSWTVAAQSKRELIPMYKKLNYLASSLTPDYSANGYMRGNLVQLTVGGYLYEQPGFITSLTYDIQEDTTWEIGIGTDTPGDGTVKELPHIIRVTGFQFTPIHRFRPQLQTLQIEGNTGFPTKYGSNTANQRYIALANGEGAQNNNYNYPARQQPRRSR